MYSVCSFRYVLDSSVRVFISFWVVALVGFFLLYTDTKEHYKNLLRKFPKVTYEPITKIINNQQDVKLRLFTQDEFDVALSRIKNKKSCQSWWNTTRSMENKEIRQYISPILQCSIWLEHNRQMDKRLHQTFPQERWPWNCQELPLLP